MSDRELWGRAWGAVIALCALGLYVPTNYGQHHPQQWFGLALAALLVGAALGAVIVGRE